MFWNLLQSIRRHIPSKHFRSMIRADSIIDINEFFMFSSSDHLKCVTRNFTLVIGVSVCVWLTLPRLLGMTNCSCRKGPLWRQFRLSATSFDGVLSLSRSIWNFFLSSSHQENLTVHRLMRRNFQIQHFYTEKNLN